MPRNIIVINSTNYIASSGNKFIYTLPNNGAKFGPNSKIGIQSLSMFNSTFNISAALGNNTFSIIWYANFSGQPSQTYNFVIPDGYYSVSDLNYYLQSQMYVNKLYLTSSSGTVFNYFFEIQTNTVRYALQINTYALPSTTTFATSGYSLPIGAIWTVATTIQTPQLNICSGLQTWLGFSSQSSFPSVIPQTTNQQFLSTSCPIVNPVNSYILTCNLISSKYYNPDNVFYSLPLTSTFGELITQNISSITYHDIRQGPYTQVIIQFYDQNLSVLQFVDKEILLILSIETD
jgi:hypothetical protein